MLLKLIPAKQEPTIHFSISFAELPANIPAPPSWTAQLSHLMREDLEVPATLHSLDRAVGIPSLLEEVALDMEMKEVRCRFIDGAIERFTFESNGENYGNKLTDALEGIVRTVKESSMEDERILLEQEQERETQRTRSMSVSTVPTVPGKTTGKIGKHKKQRSLFMHLVSCVGSIVNLTSPSTSSFSSRSLSSLKSPTSPNASSTNSSFANPSVASSSSSCHSPKVYTPPTPGTSPRARALRRAARSALVDAFRQFVLGELSVRFYAIGPQQINADSNDQKYRYVYRHQRERGGFCVWILHSMRRRALERMEQLLEAAGSAGQVISFVQEVQPRSVRFSQDSIDNELCPTTMDVPLSFSDEEDEMDDVQAASITEGEASIEANTDAASASENDTAESATAGGISVTSTAYPARPSMGLRRTSSSHSSDSFSTDSSSHSSSTTSSSDTTSTTSTAASSVESEPSINETESPPTPPKDFAATATQPQYPQQQISILENNFKELHHPPMHHLPPAAQHEYSQLLELYIRLGHLVQFAASQTRIAAEESRNRLDILAVRSRRRAWLNKALKTPHVKSGSSLIPGRVAGGGAMYGFATPFRSSPLAKYVLSADDLARKMSAISRGSTSSSSSLSSTYFRSVSSSSSASSSLSKGSSSRPRIRPRIDYEAALAVIELDNGDPADLDCNDFVDVTDALLEDDYEQDEKKVSMGRELEIYEVNWPTRTRRHRRRRTQDLPTLVVATPHGGKLFPVTEERESCHDEFALAIRGRGKPRIHDVDAEKNSRTFMGCDEIKVEDGEDEDGEDDMEDDMEDTQHLELGFGFPLQIYPCHDRPMQHMETVSPTDVDMDHMNVEAEMDSDVPIIIERPKIRPRIRTNSMIGVLLHSAKGVQKAFGGSSKQQPKPQYRLRSPSPSNRLPGDSLLCQPITIPQPPPVVPFNISHEQTPAASYPLPVHAPNRRAADVSRMPSSAIYTNIEVGLDVEMDIQIRVGDSDSTGFGKGASALPLSFPLPLTSKIIQPNIDMPAAFEMVEPSSQPQSLEQEEFTLAMDIPRSGSRRRPGYQTKHRSSHLDYEGNCRPKLDGIFSDSAEVSIS